MYLRSKSQNIDKSKTILIEIFFNCNCVKFQLLVTLGYAHTSHGVGSVQSRNLDYAEETLPICPWLSPFA